MNSTDNVPTNLGQVRELFRQAAGADLVVFPENSLYFRIRGGTPLEPLRLDGPEIASLRELVDAQPSAMMLSTPIHEAGARTVNATVLLEPGRAPRIVYRKIHMFDVDVEGAPPVRESDHFAPGTGPAVIEFRGWKIGLSICYDLRFAELYRHYAQSVDLILIPSAFLVPTGQAHWHVLLRARAIENQCYVAAPAQAGEHRSAVDSGQSRHTFGHSLVVDPWGKICKELPSGVGIGIVELDRGLIAKARRQIPMASHRRL